MESYIPADIFRFAVPLTETEGDDEYTLHFYRGFMPALASTICTKYLAPLVRRYSLEPIHVYLYLVDCKHDYDNELTQANCNNGFTMFVGELPNLNISIVVYRYMFWPKVLIHEILHVLWRAAGLPIIPNVSPKYDESIVEHYAVQIASSNKYISSQEYAYYLATSRQKVIENVCKQQLPQTRIPSKPRTHITAGNAGEVATDYTDEQINHVMECQKTWIAEYLFLIDKVRKMNERDQWPDCVLNGTVSSRAGKEDRLSAVQAGSHRNARPT